MPTLKFLPLGWVPITVIDFYSLQFYLGTIDEEVNLLLNESYKRASTLLKNHQKEWKALAEALITYETLDSDEVKAIIDGKSLPKKQKPINGESITRDVSLNKSSLASPLGEPLVQ